MFLKSVKYLQLYGHLYDRHLCFPFSVFFLLSINLYFLLVKGIFSFFTFHFSHIISRRVVYPSYILLLL